MTETTSTAHTGRRCPDCGGRVKRILRSANDKRRWDADQWRRYRCRQASCRWQGLMRVNPDRHGRARRSWSALPLASRILHVMAMLIVTAGLIWGGLLALGMLTSS